jgi:hypothetical protein
VIGNSGYHNLHRLAPGAAPNAKVVFEAGDHPRCFLSLTSDGKTISGQYNSVAKEGTVTAGANSFTAGS